MQAKPEGVKDRVPGHCEHQNDCGRDQPIGEPTLRAAIIAADDSRTDHGISPLPSMAFWTWMASSSAVRSGSMEVIGARVAEMRVDIAW